MRFISFIKIQNMLSFFFFCSQSQFGQKDALVEKWKEASEESRRLVELLKKHNAGNIYTYTRTTLCCNNMTLSLSYMILN